ncbi:MULTISPECIES: hypothetical protein [unclassified Vibrio]|uniref:hypothetical protein n=1 Tax=unclassified Vibrio TaxID=2614977 RepID=UPI002F429196
MNIESRHDLLFESNTLFILFFIYFFLAKRVVTSYLVRNGFLLLIINQAYDVVTEIEFLTSLMKVAPIESETKRQEFKEALIKTDQAMYQIKHSQREGREQR